MTRQSDKTKSRYTESAMTALLAPAVVAVDDVDLPAFALAEELPAGDGAWHRHQFGQLLYASAGALQLHTRSGQWLLPPQRAAWLAAGVEHCVAVTHHASLRTVYLGAELCPCAPTDDCAVFALPQLGRELLARATRHGPSEPWTPAAARLFGMLGDLCGEWAATPLTLRLPSPDDTATQRAIACVVDDVRTATLARAAKAAALSTRSLERRLRAAGTSFRALVQTARLMRAVQLLTDPAAALSIGEVAWQVGYTSQAAFSHAFGAVFAEGPLAYRRLAIAPSAQPGVRD